MPISGATIVAMLALFWGLVLIWVHAGLLAVIVLAASLELALALALRLRKMRQARAVDIRQRDRS
ncbi:MAG: hypothetical protein QNJ13_08755 [Paracoccaceae bacterium]|nr:hypothetical protein [Paracoccaceae bacterium]